jgi:hypothetical protein
VPAEQNLPTAIKQQILGTANNAEGMVYMAAEGGGLALTPAHSDMEEKAHADDTTTPNNILPHVCLNPCFVTRHEPLTVLKRQEPLTSLRWDKGVKPAAELLMTSKAVSCAREVKSG